VIDFSGSQPAGSHRNSNILSVARGKLARKRRISTFAVGARYSIRIS
jgi:hypothetical protein